MIYASTTGILHNKRSSGKARVRINEHSSEQLPSWKDSGL